MPTSPPCAYPRLAGSTGYARGCHCRRCSTAAAQIRERHALKRAEAKRQADARKQEEGEHNWSREHRDALAEAERATGRKHTTEEHYDALRRDLAPPFVTGPFSDAEDRAIIAWRGTDLMLAVALGRTYWAVVGRKHRLRRAGRMWD